MFFSSARRLTSVAVLGAAGGIGQPLSLLLKNTPYVTDLRLYDIKGVPGVAADLSHIPSVATVMGSEQLEQVIKGSEVVIIPAGIPRKPGMTRDDLFSSNASVIKTLTAAIAKHSPKAHICIITNPVNSTVAIAAEVLKAAGVYDPKRLYGVTELDLLRARTFVSEALGKKIDKEFSDGMSVVGGHSGHTIIPLLSAYPSLSKEQIEKITYRIQFGGDEVVKAKAGAGSATLSMAQAGATFAANLLRAINGEKGVTEHAYVESSLHPSVSYFSSRLELDVNGVKKVLPLPKLSPYEEELLKKCLVELKGSIDKGVDFVKAK